MKNEATRECLGCGGSGKPGDIGADGVRHYAPGTTVAARGAGPTDTLRLATVYRDEPYRHRNWTTAGAYLLWIFDGRPEQWVSTGGWHFEGLIVCATCLGSGRVADGPFRRDAEVDAESLRLARQDCLADYQTGRVDALDFVRAGNMLAEAK
jgi:hypothetical protein